MRRWWSCATSSGELAAGVALAGACPDRRRRPPLSCRLRWARRARPPSPGFCLRRYDAGCKGTDYAPASYMTLPPGSPPLPAEVGALLLVRNAAVHLPPLGSLVPPHPAGRPAASMRSCVLRSRGGAPSPASAALASRLPPRLLAVRCCRPEDGWRCQWCAHPRTRACGACPLRCRPCQAAAAHCGCRSAGAGRCAGDVSALSGTVLCDRGPACSGRGRPRVFASLQDLFFIPQLDACGPFRLQSPRCQTLQQASADCRPLHAHSLPRSPNSPECAFSMRVPQPHFHPHPMPTLIPNPMDPHTPHASIPTAPSPLPVFPARCAMLASGAAAAFQPDTGCV